MRYFFMIDPSSYFDFDCVKIIWFHFNCANVSSKMMNKRLNNSTTQRLNDSIGKHLCVCVYFRSIIMWAPFLEIDQFTPLLFYHHAKLIQLVKCKHDMLFGWHFFFFLLLYFESFFNANVFRNLNIYFLYLCWAPIEYASFNKCRRHFDDVEKNECFMKCSILHSWTVK